MAFNRTKRALLVRHIGEAGVAAIEKGLEDKERELKAAGIAFKEVGAKHGVVDLAGATSFDELDKVLELSALTSTFDGILSNIMQATDIDAGERAALIKAAAAELEKRLGSLGDKAMNVLNPSGPAKLPDSPGGRGLAQIVAIRGKGNGTNGKASPDTPGGRALKQIGGA